MHRPITVSCSIKQIRIGSAKGGEASPAGVSRKLTFNSLNLIGGTYERKVHCSRRRRDLLGRTRRQCHRGGYQRLHGNLPRQQCQDRQVHQGQNRNHRQPDLPVLRGDRGQNEGRSPQFQRRYGDRRLLAPGVPGQEERLGRTLMYPRPGKAYPRCSWIRRATSTTSQPFPSCSSETRTAWPRRGTRCRRAGRTCWIRNGRARS